MGKKHDKRGKKKVVLSLAEFNEDAGVGGVDPELAALPSAPKPAEEWEAQGGRPEYNSRGYKERTSSAFKDRGFDDDFDDRDWARRGPLEERDNASGFGMGADRDWGDMRRGPLDADGQAAPERNWDAMRRGPVDSAFDPADAPERDWSARKGPVDADLPARVIDDDQWGSARRAAVEADFPATPSEQDWSVRKPVEAEGAQPPEESDWSAPRKGPVEAELPKQDAERDWSSRKGPIDAETPKSAVEADWSDVRRGPVEADVPQRKEANVDWAKRRGPVDTDVDSVQKAVREIDFTDMRRGAKLQQLDAEAEKPSPGETVERTEVGRENWRRDSAGSVGRRGPHEGRPNERPASTGHDGTPKERDWGAARRTQPVKARHSRPNSARHSGGPADLETKEEEKLQTPEAKFDNDDDWTTVRSAGQRRSLNRRSGGRDGSFQKRGGPRPGPGEETGERSLRSGIPAQQKTPTTSPVTPVTPAVSES